MDFGEVLKTAWKITWRFKVLWLFGILASCGSRSGGGFNSGYSTSSSKTPGAPPNLPPGFPEDVQRLIRFFENPAVLAGLLGLICLVVLVTLFISTMGRIGLIRGALAAEGGAERLTFGGLWRESTPYFWRVLGLTLLFALPFFIIFGLAAVGIVLALANVGTAEEGAAVGLMFLLLCPLACVVLLLSFLLGLVFPQAENAIVVENRSFLNGLQRGWEVFAGNLGPILILWLILFLITLAISIGMAAPLLVVIMPLFASAALTQNEAFSYLPLIAAGLCITAYLPVSLLVNGILTTYTQSAWTLTYLRLTRPAPLEAGIAAANA